MGERRPVSNDDFVIDIPVLSADECALVVAEVEALRSLWVPRRSKSYVFHTLGAASYLDSDEYYEKAARFNGQLERSFGWLYERLLQALGGALGYNVALEPRAARPGFHIMGPNDRMRIPGGDPHFDVQFSRVDWAEGDRLDFSNPLSYTMAVRLPHSGAGLNLWSVTWEDFRAMESTARDSLDLGRTAAFVPYREGGLVSHSGLRLHTGAPSHSDLRPQDLRLTLQGHGLWCEDTYLLYW